MHAERVDGADASGTLFSRDLRAKFIRPKTGAEDGEVFERSTARNNIDVSSLLGDEPQVLVGTTAPEPATFALLGIGLAGIGFSRRQRSCLSTELDGRRLCYRDHAASIVALDDHGADER